jgi:hypothetical protein
MAEVKALVFMNDAFGEPAVLIHDPGVIGR